MIIINNFKDLSFQLSMAKSEGRSIGFVPTMGALHEGHSSLIKMSKEKSNLTICSIFVNPLQFNNQKDYINYPITIENDISILENLNCDILFLPSEKEIYPTQTSKEKHYDLGYLENILEGKFRPGHFQGVCLVVERLLTMVNPDLLFLGQKDYQQCLVIEKLIQLMNAEIQVVRCPTLREKSGLAKSSRNLRLSERELEKAAEIYKILKFIWDNSGTNSFSALKKEAAAHLGEIGFTIDYIALANADNLQLDNAFSPGKKQVILIAAFLNEIRLIDNLEGTYSTKS